MPGLVDFLESVPLVCPEDRVRLLYADGKLTCAECGASYQTYGDYALDILPKRRVDLGGELASRYLTDYAAASATPLSLELEPWAWGTRSKHSEREISRRDDRIAWLREVVQAAGSVRDAVLCDVSAGAGHYSSDYASLFRYVVHCDLVPNGIVYAYRRSLEASHTNIYFLRHDYLCSPLQESADVVICMDTLIRGRAHEVMLLKNIRRALRQGGYAIVDFANLRRQSARRALRPQQRLAKETRAYSTSAARRMLGSAGFENAELLRMPGTRLAPLPRLVYMLQKP
jgi:ubiquinone/menaquinone biosynthesis C-methylase UbiE